MIAVVKRKTDELDIWAVAARKYDMTYGQYVAAVERHGTLPPPQKIEEPESEPEIRTCVECGREIELYLSGSGRMTKSKYCEACRLMRENVAKKNCVIRNNKKKKKVRKEEKE